MSPVETLREAARAMRADAEHLIEAVDHLTDAWETEANAAASAVDRCRAVLPPLADWLDAHARDLASADGDRSMCDSPGDLAHALAVARAYLGAER